MMACEWKGCMGHFRWRWKKGTNSKIYAAALKTLKQKFGHSTVVANLMSKALFDQPRDTTS